MKIQLVDSSHSEKSFLDIPSYIYKNDPNWIPHIRQDLEKVFDKEKNKLFNEGKLERWVLFDKNQEIGRIAAFVNKNYSDGMEFPTGGIGFFECIDDQKGANLLFDVAIIWLEKQGMKAVDGSINFGEKNMFWGVLVKNFSDMGSYGMNYNLSYYQKLFEEYGFETYYNQFCYMRDPLASIREKFTIDSKEIYANPDYTFSDVRGKSMDVVAQDFLTVYNNSWGGHHGFKKMTLKQAMGTMKALKPVLDKKIIFFVFYQKKPIAFYVNIPELNEIFLKVNGNLNWKGKLIFLYHKIKRTPKTMVGLVFGVDREFHGRGVEKALLKFTSKSLLEDNHYTNAIVTWIGDFNPKMVTTVESTEAKKYRILTTYRYMIDKTIPFERIKMAK